MIKVSTKRLKLKVFVIKTLTEVAATQQRRRIRITLRSNFCKNSKRASVGNRILETSLEGKFLTLRTKALQGTYY